MFRAAAPGTPKKVLLADPLADCGTQALVDAGLDVVPRYGGGDALKEALAEEQPHMLVCAAPLPASNTSNRA